MRKILTILFSLVVNIIPTAAQNSRMENVLRTDTLYRTDTIHIKEVITRTDIVHRTEQIVRYYGEKPFEEESQGIENIPKSPVTEEINITDETSVSGGLLNMAGGRYVWVPDSLDQQVTALLDKGVFVNEVSLPEEEEAVDLTEKVVFRGDTINMVLKDRNLGRYDRGLFNFLFIPKGIWQVGLTASYGEFSTSDLQILDLVSDIDFSGKLWSIKPYFSYFIRSNISLGLRLGYTHGKASVGSFNVDIDSDMSFNLHDIVYKSNSYSAAVTFAQYLGIARKGRFGIFNEVELALSGGNSDFNRPFNGAMRRTHTTTFQTALNFSPGVCVYVLDQVSFNVSLGVFGLNIKHEKQKVDDEDLGWRTTSGANFRFNIFNINFGIAVNI